MESTVKKPTDKKHARRPRWQLALMWSLSLLMFPLLLAQGVRTRNVALRLPEGEPPVEGRWGQGEPELSVLGLGDSVIAGVGVTSMTESLTAAVAKAWHEKTGKTVSWESRGVNGSKLADLVAAMDEQPPQDASLTIVSIGVNDVSGLTSLIRWQMQVMDMITRLGSRRRIVLLGVPPMEFFHALPQPLRWVLGIRAALLDKTLHQVGDLLANVTWIDAAQKFDEEHLANDGYHPNALACMEIAVEIVDAVVSEE